MYEVDCRNGVNVKQSVLLWNHYKVIDSFFQISVYYWFFGYHRNQTFAKYFLNNFQYQSCLTTILNVFNINLIYEFVPLSFWRFSRVLYTVALILNRIKEIIRHIELTGLLITNNMSNNNQTAEWKCNSSLLFINTIYLFCKGNFM